MVSPIVSQHKLCKSITTVVGHSSGWRRVVQWVDLHITGSLFPAPISTSYILASWSACYSLWQWALRFLHAYEVWIDDGGQSCSVRERSWERTTVPCHHVRRIWAIHGHSTLDIFDKYMHICIGFDRPCDSAHWVKAHSIDSSSRLCLGNAAQPGNTTVIAL